MTWEQAVDHLRKDKSKERLINDAYLSLDLNANVLNFSKSKEFSETLNIINNYYPKTNNLRLLDLGAGNGMASASFAKKGFNVTALEPDKSNMVGSGAIKTISNQNKLKIEIVESYGESLPFDSNTFEIVYARQVLHHATNLEQLLSEVHRVLKPNGTLISSRDHCVRNEKGKEIFLKNHPLHKYYGGENAFTPLQYRNAIINAGLIIKKTFKASESVINIEPWSQYRLKNFIKEKYGNFIASIPLLSTFAWFLFKIRLNRIPGTLITFIAQK